MIDPKDVPAVLGAGPVEVPLAAERGHLEPAPLLEVGEQRRLLPVGAVEDALLRLGRLQAAPDEVDKGGRQGEGGR